MKDWERAESMVRGLLGGRRTPGSGNKKIKQDIRAGSKDYNGWAIEVKQTSKDCITLQRSWFTKLEQEHKIVDVALVLSFGLKLIAFVPYSIATEMLPEATLYPRHGWKSLQIRWDAPIEYVCSGDWIWQKISMVELTKLVKGNEH